MRHYFYLDTRMERKCGTYPLKLVVSTNGKRIYLHTGICLEEECWDSYDERVTGGLKDERQLNMRIERIRLEVADFLATNLSISVSISELRRILGCIIEGRDWREKEGANFLQLYKSFADTHQHERTKLLYYSTIKRIEAFDPHCETLTIDDITHEWLTRFDRYMQHTAPSANSRSIHMRNIRAVFNDAIAREITTKYPFRRFKIKSQRTRHRALQVDALRDFMTMPILDQERKYRDMWVLMFMLCGISPIDLCYLKEIRHGRITYRRSKTDQPLDIKVEPEAMEIIDRYHGENYLIDVLDRFPDHMNWLRRLNMGLKTLGGVTHHIRTAADGKQRLTAVREETWPDLSAYWARHTWASIAASLDVPKETIAQALGHSQHSVTDIYIDFDRTKVDRANRRVLDWVLYSKC